MGYILCACVRVDGISRKGQEKIGHRHGVSYEVPRKRDGTTEDHSFRTRRREVLTDQLHLPYPRREKVALRMSAFSSIMCSCSWNLRWCHLGTAPTHDAGLPNCQHRIIFHESSRKIMK